VEAVSGSQFNFRRYVVLTKKHMLTFKDNTNYSNPTEVIEMIQCSTVKSADDETFKTNSFVLNST